jgi:hypothetical protein
MAVSLLNPKKSVADQVFARMNPGEIYSEGGYTGMAPEFYSPAPNPNDPREAIMQQYGYRDYMNSQRNPDDEAARMLAIQNAGGPGMSMNVQDPYIQAAQNWQEPPVNQQKVEQYRNLSDADQVALQYVNSGQMTPKELYDKMKDVELKREIALLKLKSEAPIDRMDLSKDGQAVPMDAANLAAWMSGQGVSADFRPPETHQFINSETTRNGGVGSGGKGSASAGSGGVPKDLDDLLKQRDEAMKTYSSLISDTKQFNQNPSAALSQLALVQKLDMTRELYQSPLNNVDIQTAGSIASSVLGTGRAVMDSGTQPLIAGKNGDTLLNLNGIVKNKDGSARRVMDLFAMEGNTQLVTGGQAYKFVEDAINAIAGVIVPPYRGPAMQ